MAQQPKASNLLTYVPDCLLTYVPDCLVKAAWDKNSALMFYKLIRDLKQMATLIPLVHPSTGNKYDAVMRRRDNRSGRSPCRSLASRDRGDVHPSGSGATRAPRNNGISISNMEAAAGPAIPALCSAAAGRVGSYGTSLLPQYRETTKFWGKKQGPTVFLWESLDEGGREECERAIRTHKDWVMWTSKRRLQAQRVRTGRESRLPEESEKEEERTRSGENRRRD